ncbi:MAG: response regulator transcription factor [Candidatus Eremiobacteraeota bacterium]|nr:response regulator transcription factor [Candidatus Eremiobacteraeota bacterium]
MRILVIEDNNAVAKAVRTMLESRHYAVDLAADGEAGLDYLLRGIYDAAIVDIGLPRRNGFSIVESAREHNIQTPILMLTARDGVEDRVSGLESGADDYLPKPFAEEELVARVKALLRRGNLPVVERFDANGLVVDVGARTAAYCGRPIELGTTEFRLLEFLARNAGIAFSRAQLLEHVWDYDFEGSSNIVDVYISQIRRKLKSAGARDLIVTVWGVGYKLGAS